MKPFATMRRFEDTRHAPHKVKRRIRKAQRTKDERRAQQLDFQDQYVDRSTRIRY